MEVDVIIPTHNRAHTLKRAIDSVFNQSYKHFNLYVIDDASTDSSLEIIESYKSKPNFHFHQLPENLGVSFARNIGVNLGQSNFIAFLDSDDEWLEHKLERQFNFLKNHPHLNFVHSEEIWIRNGVRVNPKLKHSKTNDDIFNRSLDHCLISPSTSVMKRELFIKLGGFNTELVICEDYDLWLKVLLENEVGYISTPLIKKYGGHPDQLSLKYVAMDFWRIKSLISLLKRDFANDEKRKRITSVIENKSLLLMANAKKHSNYLLVQELSELLNSQKIKLF